MDKVKALKQAAVRRAAVWLAAGLVYVLWPLDLVPDWAVLVGWVDDAFVVFLAAYMAYQALKEGSPVEKSPRGPEHAKPAKVLPPDPDDLG